MDHKTITALCSVSIHWYKLGDAFEVRCHYNWNDVTDYVDVKKSSHTNGYIYGGHIFLDYGEVLSAVISTIDSQFTKKKFEAAGKGVPWHMK